MREYSDSERSSAFARRDSASSSDGVTRSLISSVHFSCMSNPQKEAGAAVAAAGRREARGIPLVANPGFTARGIETGGCPHPDRMKVLTHPFTGRGSHERTINCRHQSSPGRSGSDGLGAGVADFIACRAASRRPSISFASDDESLRSVKHARTNWRRACRNCCGSPRSDGPVDEGFLSWVGMSGGFLCCVMTCAVQMNQRLPVRPPNVVVDAFGRSRYPRLRLADDFADLRLRKPGRLNFEN